MLPPLCQMDDEDEHLKEGATSLGPGTTPALLILDKQVRQRGCILGD